MPGGSDRAVHHPSIPICENSKDPCAFRLVDLAFLAQHVRQVGKYLAQHFLAAPLLEPPMHVL